MCCELHVLDVTAMNVCVAGGADSCVASRCVEPNVFETTRDLQKV